MVLKGFLGTIGGTMQGKILLQITWRTFLIVSGIHVIERSYLLDHHLNPPTNLFLKQLETFSKSQIFLFLLVFQVILNLTVILNLILILLLILILVPNQNLTLKKSLMNCFWCMHYSYPNIQNVCTNHKIDCICYFVCITDLLLIYLFQSRMVSSLNVIEKCTKMYQ